MPKERLFEQAAIRVLFEETSVVVKTAGRQVAQRFANFVPASEMVDAEERYFVVRADHRTVWNVIRTEMEHTVMAVHRWWSQAELEVTDG